MAVSQISRLQAIFDSNMSQESTKQRDMANNNTT